MFSMKFIFQRPKKKKDLSVNVPVVVLTTSNAKDQKNKCTLMDCIESFFAAEFIELNGVQRVFDSLKEYLI